MRVMANVVPAGLVLGSLLALGPSLREARQQADVFDPLKYLPLTPDGALKRTLRWAMVQETFPGTHPCASPQKFDGGAQLQCGCLRLYFSLGGQGDGSVDTSRK